MSFQDLGISSLVEEIRRCDPTTAQHGGGGNCNSCPTTNWSSHSNNNTNTNARRQGLVNHRMGRPEYNVPLDPYCDTNNHSYNYGGTPLTPTITPSGTWVQQKNNTKSIRNQHVPELTCETRRRCHSPPPPPPQQQQKQQRYRGGARGLDEDDKVEEEKKETEDSRKRNIPQQYRTPPPQLTTRCPVTHRLLLVDDGSKDVDGGGNNETHEERRKDSSSSGRFHCTKSPPTFSVVTDNKEEEEEEEEYLEDPPALTPGRRRRHHLQSSSSSSSSSSVSSPSAAAVSKSNNRTTTPSIYSHLTSEIVNYQKMVAELETLLEPSSYSPEAQWRSRILIRSAQDADRDIWKRLYDYNETYFGEEQVTNNPNSNSRAQLASRKLHRDFRRVHKSWTSIVEQYKQRQQIEVSFLSATAEATTTGRGGTGATTVSSFSNQSKMNSVLNHYHQDNNHNNNTIQSLANGEEKEDFFDRAMAMRERDAELRRIRDSVHKVNEIYTDLAALVEEQQDKVDTVADQVNYARGATMAGAEQFHKAAHGMCASLPTSFTTIEEETGKETTSTFRIGESFSWAMPFETLHDDFRAVRNDVMEFGREMIQEVAENLQDNPNLEHIGLQCSGFEFPTTGSMDEQQGVGASIRTGS